MIKHFRWTAILATALIVMALPIGGLAAVNTPCPSGPTMDYPQGASSLKSRVEAMQTTVDLTKLRLDAAVNTLKAQQERVEAGLAPSGELAPLQEDIAELQRRLSQALSELHDMERLAAFAKPVDVEVKEATLRQVAEALAKATGLKITVDQQVKDDPQKAFTLKVQGAPLGQVLEQIADGAKVLIAPDKEGVVLVPEVVSSINGVDSAPPSITSPWSDEWAITLIVTNEGDYLPVGQRWRGLIEAATAAPAPSCIVTAMPAPPPIGGTQGGYAVFGSSQPLLAGMGPDMFIVGEQGTDGKGELGLWLQFYKIAGNKVTPGIRYFHHFATDKTAPEGK